MPWPPKQQRAIAANLARQGKSREQISAFFRKHGYGGALTAARRKKNHRP